MYEMGKPKSRGVFDANMGTTDSAYVCETCQMDKGRCQGHSGHFELNYPCLNPIMLAEIKKWLKVICFNCGNPIIKVEEIRATIGTGPKSFENLTKSLTNTVKPCAYCNQPHFPIKRPENTSFTFIVKKIAPDGSASDMPLYPHNIAEIFDKISDETVVALGRSVVAHPRNFVWHCIYIPPPAIRPDTRKQGGRGSSNDSITARLKEFIAYHNKNTKQTIPQEIEPKFAEFIGTLNETLAEILTRGNDRSKSIAMRIKGKHGRIRENLLGKRTHGLARSTIDGSPRLNLDQISIPLFIAQTLQIEETIQEYNRERLAPFIANGVMRYPGCSRITKRDGSVFKPDSPGLRLENGDIIMRDLINGDIVAFNRQPTLTLANTTSVRIVVDRTALAVGMSSLTCPFFNADFDGDQMNILNYMKISSLNEQIMMTNVASRMVSATTGNMLIGQSGDSLLGIAKMTQSGVAFDRYHAGLIFSTANCVPHFERIFTRDVASPSEIAPRSSPSETPVIGRDLVSLALARTPISYRGKSAYYESGAPWMKWMEPSPGDASVEIVGGKIMRGCLDKPSTGPGASSIYQMMVHEFGPQRTLDVIYDMQQLGINYISQHGFTTGIHDFFIMPEERAKITQTSQGTLTKSYQIVDQLNRGLIIPPIDKTILQFYEENQINTQRVVDDYYEPVIRSIRNPRTNGVFEMLATGCKGSPTFLVNMVATVGLVMISGERVRPNFGYMRTLPYFQRFEESPEARGYVGTSFMQGLTLVGCIFNAMMARTDIISRALMTSITGYQNRKSIKSLESAITNNFRMVVKENSIVSFVYGGDYFDPRFLENVSYGPAMIANADFINRYRYVAANPSKQAIFDAEFAAISADREEYRRIFKTIEDLSVRDKMSASIKLPVNIPRLAERLSLAIANSGIAEMEKGTPIERAVASSSRMRTEDVIIDNDDTFAEVAEVVAQFCKDIPYLFINQEQKDAGGWVPEFISSASTLLRMYVRAEMCAQKVREMRKKCSQGIKLTSFVAAILEGIGAIVMTSLVDTGQTVGIIAAQSFSEPFTQDMLDSYKLSAITGGNATRVKMSKCREIMNAYEVKKLLNPMMTIVLEPEYAASAERAQEVAQRIEMLKFSQLVATSQIFYERFGDPVHPQYASEKEIFAQFAEDNPMMVPPGDLVTWCMRFEIDKSALVQKNISIQAIVAKLRERYSDLYLVYTTERARRAIIRAYVTASGLSKFSVQTTEMDAHHGRAGPRRSHEHEARIHEVYTTILGTIVRGVEGVGLARVEKFVRTKMNADGSIVDDGAMYGVRTNGTNLVRASCVPGVRANMIQTDAIQELASVLGIEAARYRIIMEMRGLVEKCNVRHYMIYADEMTRTGRVISIEHGGLAQRETSNIALRAGYASPVQAFTEAAVSAKRNMLYGVSAPLTFGAIPRLGTLYNAFMVDPEVIHKYKKTAMQALEDI
jgi:DNA-directed RNA polymerase beta' subunit